MQLNDRTRLRNDASCALRGCRAARVMVGAGGLGRRTQSRCRARKPTAAAISDGGADEGLAIRVSYGSSSCACGKQVSMSSPLDLKRGNIHRARVFAPWNPPSPPVRVPRDPARTNLSSLPQPGRGSRRRSNPRAPRGREKGHYSTDSPPSLGTFAFTPALRYGRRNWSGRTANETCSNRRSHGHFGFHWLGGLGECTSQYGPESLPPPPGGAAGVGMARRARTQ